MPNICIPPQRVAELKAQLSEGKLDPDTIKSLLPEEKTALKSLLEDFVSEKLNVTASADEVKVISTKAKKIDEAQKKLGENLGNPTDIKGNIDFFTAKRDMDKYLESLNPSSKLRVATGTIGRGMMLASIKSPILNIGSNIEAGLTEAAVRRLSGGGFKGADNQLAREYRKMVWQVYNKTGYDVSRMVSLSDGGAGGARVLDDVGHSQGKGAVRKAGRIVEDVVFKNLMGAPDAKFGALHFADSVNTGALKMAKGDKKLAREIMEDSMRLEPQTPQGEILRTQGILDAQTATWTNKSWASKASLGIRKVLDDLSGDLRVGTYLMPFVKTPANVISTGLDYAGLGIPKALFKTVEGMRKGTIKDREAIQSTGRDLVRSGLGITGAAVIVANIQPDDFVGAYDPKRKQIEELRNSSTNSVKIGGKWISMDWFGPLSVPMTAILYAKKYGKDPASAVFEYGKGASSTIINLPGIDTVGEAYKNYQEKKDQTAGETTGEATDYVTSELYSRLVPSFFSDIARAMDPNERKTGKGIEGIQAKIPGLREQLPIKKNAFGEDIKAEDPVSRILFGSRVKTDKEDATIGEINRVATANDKGVTFTDWEKSSSKIIAQFKDKVGPEKFNEAKELYGRALKMKLQGAFGSSDYKKLDDQDRLAFINNQDTKTMKAVFDKYGFKYKRAD